MRKEKMEQMMGLDEIAELTESQIVGKSAVNQNQLDRMQAKASARQIEKSRKQTTPGLKSVEEVFKNKKMTFDDIHKLNYQQFNKPGRHEAFKPSDILDLNDKDSDDEILSKFKKKRLSPKTKHRVPGAPMKFDPTD